MLWGCEMLRFLFSSSRMLHRALADERRTVKALRKKCADLRAYQERIASDNRYLSQQNMHLTCENTRALETITDLKAELHNLRASRQRDAHGRFVK